MNKQKILEAFWQVGHNTPAEHIDKAIAALNLPAEDGYEYEPEQILQIQDYLLNPLNFCNYAPATEAKNLLSLIADRQEQFCDQMADQVVEILDERTFWRTLWAKITAKMEGRPQAAPFVLEPIEAPQMSDSVARYLRSSRQQSFLPPSPSQPVLDGASGGQSQQELSVRGSSTQSKRKR